MTGNYASDYFCCLGLRVMEECMVVTVTKQKKSKCCLFLWAGSGEAIVQI